MTKNCLCFVLHLKAVFTVDVIARCGHFLWAEMMTLCCSWIGFELMHIILPGRHGGVHGPWIRHCLLRWYSCKYSWILKYSNTRILWLFQCDKLIVSVEQGKKTNFNNYTDLVNHWIFNLRSLAIYFYAITADRPDLKLSNFAFPSIRWSEPIEWHHSQVTWFVYLQTSTTIHRKRHSQRTFRSTVCLTACVCLPVKCTVAKRLEVWDGRLDGSRDEAGSWVWG